MRIKILGKYWDLRFTHHGLSNNDGECESPDTPDKKIRVKPSLSGKRALESVIHEMHHAADWHKDEEWVHEVAEDQARVLCRKEVLSRVMDDPKLLDKIETILKKHGWRKSE